MTTDSTVRRIYDELLEFSDAGHYNWVSKIKSLFSNFNISINDMANKNREELKSFEIQFCEKRYLHYMDEWRRLLIDPTSNKKLCTYRTIKVDFRLETYLLCV